MDTRTIDSFADELEKIALFDDMTPEQKEVWKRRLLDAGVAAGGFGIGYGVGSAVGRFASHARPELTSHKYFPLAVGGLTALTGLAASNLARMREEYRNQPVKRLTSLESNPAAETHRL